MNLTIEALVLRRTLNKIHTEFGFLPPVLHLQLDNASDNKSQLFWHLLPILSKKVFF